MAIVRVRGPLKQRADGRSDHVIEGATVAEVLAEFERLQPGVRGWILDERGAVRRHINVFVNGERAMGGTSVGPDDAVDVLPAISGGGFALHSVGRTNAEAILKGRMPRS